MVIELQHSDNPFLKAVGYCCYPQCVWTGCRCTEIKGCGMYDKLSDMFINGYRISEHIPLFSKEEEAEIASERR